jgi:hypothetical protein
MSSSTHNNKTIGYLMEGIIIILFCFFVFSVFGFNEPFKNPKFYFGSTILLVTIVTLLGLYLA